MPPDTGDPAPDFTLHDQHAEPVSLSQFRGQTVVE
jgi:peroxiredoxin